MRRLRCLGFRRENKGLSADDSKRELPRGQIYSQVEQVEGILVAPRTRLLVDGCRHAGPTGGDEARMICLSRLGQG